MIWRAVQVVFRLAGWLLTPLVLIAGAAFGAYLGLVLSPRMSPDGALIVTVAAALVATVLTLFGWVRLLRRNPQLREALAVTAEGVPESDAVSELIGRTAERPARGADQ